jgi:hypothetical protein
MVIPANYGASIVGTWKEKTRFPRVFEIRSDGTFTENHSYSGGCIVFAPSDGKWKIEGNLLKLAYDANENESFSSERVYQIEKLWSTGVTFRYPNPEYTGTYRRIR